jgi:hypothetical protein
MKKIILLFLFSFLSANIIYAQFDLEKFLNEKLAVFNYNRYSKMTDLEKKIVPGKYESIPVKAEYLIPKEGGIMRQSVTSDTKDVKIMTKMFDTLFGVLSKKFSKTERDESNEGVRNVVWRGPDNTMYTLSKSPAMTILTMVKMN